MFKTLGLHIGAADLHHNFEEFILSTRTVWTVFMDVSLLVSNRKIGENIFEMVALVLSPL